MPGYSTLPLLRSRCCVKMLCECAGAIPKARRAMGDGAVGEGRAPREGQGQRPKWPIASSPMPAAAQAQRIKQLNE
eukprot:11318421-Alexandrium_andersonii.AAC.1